MSESEVLSYPETDLDADASRRSRRLRFSMGGQRFEASYSHADIVGFLREAVEVVGECGLPTDELARDVFAIAQGMLATYHQIESSVQPVPAMAIPRNGKR